MKSTPSAIALAGVGALLFFLSGFIQGGLRTSADPELVVGFSEACRALGWVAVIGAGLAFGRPRRLMAVWVTRPVTVMAWARRSDGPTSPRASASWSWPAVPSSWS